MGKHGSGAPEVTRRPWPLLLAVAVLVVVAAGLGWWWWSLRDAADPIDADPVDAYAVVVSSADCPDVGVVVELRPPAPSRQATVDGCGQREGRQVAVEYLASDPGQVRLAGTTVAATPGPERWLPIGILAAGVLAVGATLFLIIERRIHHDDTPTPVSVDELRRKAAAPAAVELAGQQPGPDAAGPAPAAVPSDGPAPVPPQDPAAGTVEQQRENAPAAAPVAGPERDIGDTDQLYLGRFPTQVEVESPTSGDLFTHRGPEASDRA